MNASSDLKKLFDKIGEAGGFKVQAISRLAGGSINEVYSLLTSSGEKVIKLNKASLYPGMFEAEKQGLNAIKSTCTFDVPEVYECGKFTKFSYLLLEYIHEAKAHPQYWDIFAENLTKLHKQTADKFGYPISNYIGSLPQLNGATSTAANFYITQRLEPQLRIAANKGFIFDHLDKIFKNISTEIPNEAPALIHGDLWSGNYITNQKGLPCLIDPAVSYAPREMDLAMMKLFGGFPEDVFQTYNEIFPTQQGFKKRIPLWQLYYLLVHLNILGGGYLASVKNILSTFT